MDKNWIGSLKAIQKHPSIIMPLFFVAICEFIALSLCYYTPRPPVSLIFAPLVKAFIGERFLHYPLNFLIIGRLTFIFRIVIYLGAGLIAFGMTIASVYQIKLEKKGIRLSGNLNRSLRSYPGLLMLGLCYGAGALLAYKVPRLVALKLLGDSPALFAVSIGVFIFTFLLLVLLECALIYAPVALILDRKSILLSLGKSLQTFKNYFFKTIAFVMFFRIFNLVVFFVKNNIPNIIRNYFPNFPEVSLVILSLEMVSLFISNFFIIYFATIFFISSGDPNRD